MLSTTEGLCVGCSRCHYVTDTSCCVARWPGAVPVWGHTLNTRPNGDLNRHCMLS